MTDPHRSPASAARGPRRLTTAALAAAGALALAGCSLLGGDVPRVALQEAEGVRWLSAEGPQEQPSGQSSALVTGPLGLTPEGCLAVLPDGQTAASDRRPTLVAFPKASLMLENGRVVAMDTGGGQIVEAGVATGFSGGLIPAADLPRDVRDAVASCGVRGEVLVTGPLG
ncbi:hypothetical protein [Micrococcus sp.]|uniref:hypothetical protein n=1 Tax=Micrococcus sp. TaxID=1271 RepID=UPI0026DD75D7|nr:hypothetical protein [Micrococcus sp.]MDO4239343.1 hypothetical protein [Micrococcus sp.]